MARDNVDAAEPENSAQNGIKTLSMEDRIRAVMAPPEPEDAETEEVGVQDSQDTESEDSTEVSGDSSENPEDSTDKEDEFSFLDEEPEEPGEKADDGLPKGVQKRIDKLTRQKYELQEKYEALEQEKKDLEARLNETESQPRASGNDPLGHLTSEADLAKYEDTLTKYVDFAEQALIEYESDPEKVEKTLDNLVGDWRSQTEDAEVFLKNVLRNSNRTLRQVPKKRDALRALSQARENAVKEFPWLGDQGNKKTQWIENQKRAYPQLNQIPGIDRYLAYAVEGMAAVRGRKKAPAQPKAEPPKQPRTPSQKTSGGRGDALQTAAANVKKTGSRDALAGFIAAQMRQQ